MPDEKITFKDLLTEIVMHHLADYMNLIEDIGLKASSDPVKSARTIQDAAHESVMDIILGQTE